MTARIPEAFGGGAAGRLLGIGALVALGFVLGRGLRPAAKAAIRGFLSARDRIREFAAEADETLQDLYAEARWEHEASGAGRPAAGGEAGPPIGG